MLLSLEKHFMFQKMENNLEKEMIEEYKYSAPRLAMGCLIAFLGLCAMAGTFTYVCVCIVQLISK
jgi:hypothetical protein